MKKEDFDFVSHQNEKKFVISEEEIEEACSDVDLNSIAASEDSEIDRLTRRRNSVHDSDSEYNADVEDDDNISYSSLALDKEIINSVLDGSDERMRAAANAKYKKNLHVFFANLESFRGSCVCWSGSNGQKGYSIAWLCISLRR